MRTLLTIVALVLLAAMPARASVLTGLDLDGSPSETRLTLQFDSAVAAPQPRFIDKRRIILDFADLRETLKGTVIAGGQEVIAGEGIIRRIRYAPRGEGGLRLVLDLAGDATVTGTDTPANGYVLVVSAIGEASAPTTTSSVPVPRLKPTGRRARTPVIVIDPGHGGHDPGAIGVARSTREKDITFAASQALAKKLRATGRYKVVLTRDEDIYIAHEERLKIARLAGADLFISIHADSTSGPVASGASVYTLADRAMNRSRRIVQSQNWIMDVDLGEQSSEVGDILVDLAQRKTSSQSAEFADHLLPEVAKATSLIRNSHRRAGYFVLLAPDVPAVLLEMGFLSNPGDESKLRQDSHRNRIMDAVVRGIDGYFED